MENATDRAVPGELNENIERFMLFKYGAAAVAAGGEYGGTLC